MIYKAHEPIAIVGIGCRFPGGASPTAFWDLLHRGDHAIREVPASRFDIHAFYDADPRAPGKSTSRHGGFLESIDAFDWRAFRIPPKEASYLDPQQRLLLEVAWEALEDAGLPLEAVAGSRASVSIGITWNDYLRLQSRHYERLDAYSTSGNPLAFAANRLSYFFDLRGPSVSMDATCASSLVSLDYGCRMLWSGEVDMALVGGVNLLLSPDSFIMMSKAGILSTSGRCRALDSNADGFVRGEGAGVLVLKRVSDLGPGDRIYAQVRSISLGHNGRNEWIMAPSAAAQESVIRQAYLRENLDPTDVAYVELHGTGFPRGDPIEMQALAAALDARHRSNPCYVGSVKTNIGNLEAAAGVASVVKVALSLYHRTLPPTLFLDTINPAIRLDDLGLKPILAPLPWPSSQGSLLAGVTVTSFSGVNAHVVLEGLATPAPAYHPKEVPPPRTFPLLVSARTPEALRARIQSYSDFLSHAVPSPAWFRNICYTTALRTTHLEHRRLFWAESASDACQQLSNHLAESIEGPVPPVALAAIHHAFQRDGKVDFTPFFLSDCQVVSLPLYPWQRERLWLDWLHSSTHILSEVALPASSSPLPHNSVRSLHSSARRTDLLDHIRSRVREVLGLPAHLHISSQARLFDLGLNSLSANQLRLRLEADFQRALPATLLFDYPTPVNVVQYIESHGAVLTDGATQKTRIAPHCASDPIAVIGMACRFPGGAETPELFWQLLAEGRDAVIPLPEDHFPLPEHSLFEQCSTIYNRLGGFLTDIQRFDAPFFGISPREMESLDPQQRLALEVAWEALENAGTPPHQLAGSATGVFLGVMSTDFARRFANGSSIDKIDAWYASGNQSSFVPGRLSYFLGLHGPSIAVDTACSSSLVAVHLACQSLQAGETTVALAGGVNLILAPDLSAYLCRAGVMSRAGRCRSFDAAADGITRGEGCGIVVLKRLADAERDGDRILAIIRGSAVNHDGASGGLTVPNGLAQRALLHDALQCANVPHRSIQYLEAHGTGTPIGDPIELSAAADVYGAGRELTQPLIVGSVKSNLGHLESAAGIAGLMKTVLALQHGVIPPNLHFDAPNPRFDWHTSALRVPTRLESWPDVDPPRRAGVSSFGLSGVNAHVVLEQAPAVLANHPADVSIDGHLLLPMSARSPAALLEQARRLHRQVSGLKSEHEVYAVCATAASRRSHLQDRAAFVASDRNHLAEALSSFIDGNHRPLVFSARLDDERPPQLAFVFPGSGWQWPGMALQWMAREPVFRAAMLEAMDCVQSYTSWSVDAALRADITTSALHRSDIAQPILLIVQWAFAQLWRHFGVLPDVVLGHSGGEIAAACVAGILSLEDAARIMTRRSQIVQRVAGIGAMLSAELSLADAQRYLHGLEQHISIAVCNGPRSCVFSGDRDVLELLQQSLSAAHVFCRPVRVDYASHSPHMDCLRDELLSALAPVSPQQGSLPFFSTVNGRFEDGPNLDASYWYRNLREPVLFWPAVESLLEQHILNYVEISAHPILVPPLKDGFTAKGLLAEAVGSGRRDSDERGALLESLAALYVRGVALDWKVIQPLNGPPVHLPNYAWQREKFWTPFRHEGTSEQHIQSATEPSRHFFQGTLSLASHSTFADHQVQGMTVVPGAYFIQLAFSAARSCLHSSALHFSDCQFESLLTLDDGPRVVQLEIIQVGASSLSWTASSKSASNATAGSTVWTTHARANVRILNAESRPDGLDIGPFDGVGWNSIPDFYARMANSGSHYGVAFQKIAQVKTDGFHAQATLVSVPATEFPLLDLCILDACFHVSAAALLSKGRGTLLPVAIDSLRFYDISTPPQSVYATRQASGHDEYESASLAALALDGAVLLDVSGFRLRTLPSPSDKRSEDIFFRLAWRELGKLSRESGATDGDRKVLIMGERSDFHTELLRQLGQAGATSHILPSWAAEWRPRADDLPTDLVWTVASSCTLGSEAPSQMQRLLTWYERVIGVVRMLERLELRLWPRLVFVTAGIHTIVKSDDIPDSPIPLEASIWGFARTLRQEYPELECLCMDLPPNSLDDADAAPSIREVCCHQLAGALLNSGGEDEIILRENRIMVARLVSDLSDLPPSLHTLTSGSDFPYTTKHSSTSRASCVQAPERRIVSPGGEGGNFFPSNYRLTTFCTGDLEDLRLVKVLRRAPDPHEVEIEVVAVGLNFQDVLFALGRIPNDLGDEDPQHFGFGLGSEGAGRVVRVGKHVDTIAVGDRVVVVVPRCFSRYVTVTINRVVPLPSTLSWTEAAGLAINFLTAWYSFVHIAKLAPGERVLIHAAAGGVGQAAIQVARMFDAEIFATAGSDEKRAFLREQGIAHVADSRSLIFADDIRRATRGHGVDVVLNSLSGDFIRAGIELLQDYGRFIEIGKRDALDNRSIALRPFLRNLNYSLVDLRHMLLHQPTRLQKLLLEFWPHIESGVLKPIPHASFDISYAADAFARMARAEHRGKLVLSFPLSQPTGIVIPVAPNPFQIHADGTYLISGGRGALGLEVAKSLVGKGARSLILLGRSRPNDEVTRQLLSLASQEGVQVLTPMLDITHLDALLSFMESHQMTVPPLRGVIHAAAVLDDAMISAITPAQFARVFSVKVLGAIHLHLATIDQPLDFFVMFSSASALLGIPGQSHYAAANAFLDSFAAWRMARGLPALSINWGAWADVGLAAVDSNRGERLENRGVGSMSPKECLDALYSTLHQFDGTQRAIMRFDVRQWCDFYPVASASPIFESLRESLREAGQPSGMESRLAFLAKLDQLPADQRLRGLQEHVRDELVRVLRLPGERVSLLTPFLSLGLDSLLALEFRNRLEKSLKIKLTTTIVWTYPTLSALCSYLASRLSLGGVSESHAEAAPPVATTTEQDEAHSMTQLMAALRSLDDTDLERLLKLDSVGGR